MEVKIVGRGADTLVLNVCYADKQFQPIKQELDADLQVVLSRLQPATPYVAMGAGGTASPDAPVSIHDWCDRQDALRVIGRYVRLNPQGLGCCPFGWHHSDGKDSHPSLWVHAPRASGGPCWYCHVWQRGGNLFDFLCVWYGVSAREMWRRTLAGEQF